MSRVTKSVLVIFILLTLTLIIPVLMNSDFFDKIANAEDAGWSETTTGGDSGGTGGTTATPGAFIVLEIVPYVGMGEIGYLVGGQEPVDEDLLTKNNATGDLSFLGDAITAYDSYMEKPLPSSGTADSGWVPIKNYYTEDGYFEYVGTTGGTFRKVISDVYTHVDGGTGSYNARLGTEDTAIYTETWNQTNRKNVKAYFVYGQPAGVSLYSTTNAYEPCSVTKVKEHIGDYDYNSETKAFTLNKGKGAYNVLFARSNTGKNQYYMRSDYQIVEDFSGDYSWSLIYDYVGATGGNYIKETSGMVFNYSPSDPWNYRYKWVKSDEKKPTNFYQEGTPGELGEKIWVKGQKFEKTVEYNFNVTIVNNEWLKRYTLGIKAEDCDSFPVDVVTMTPTELNKIENQHYLKDANMFYISDNATHNTSYINLYETKSHEGLALNSSQKYNAIKDTLNFGINDLSWKSTMLIFDRVAGVKEDKSLGGYRAAVVFDSTYYQNAVQGNSGYKPYYEKVDVSFTWNSPGATVSNLAKLYIMLYQRDPVKFYKAFLAPSAPRKITEVSSARNSTGDTGSFVRPGSSAAASSIEATFWNGNTFCAYILNETTGVLDSLNIDNAADKLIIEKEIPNYNILKDTTDIITNILVLNGQDIFTKKFTEPLTGLPKDAVDEALIYLASMNGGVVPDKITISGSVNMITNSGTGYGSGTGTSTGSTGEDGTSGSNLRTYISILNIEPTADFTTSENNIKTVFDGKNIVITNMTSEEFNGSILDINTHYDMIYIGAGAGRFNLYNNNTVFNKAEDDPAIAEDKLNGSVYNKGDRILTSEGTKNYTGNDLTTSKIEDLKDFIKAGYPIVLEDSIYSLTTAVHSSTNLYSFIQYAKITAPTNFLDFAEYSSSKIVFMGKLMYAVNLIRPQIRMISPVLPDTAENNYLYVDPVTKILNIEFALVPAGLVADRTIKYNAYLYLDYNEDGIFSETERLNAVSADGSSSVGITESKFTTYRYSYDMSKYNGIYEWQVKVVKQEVSASGSLTDSVVRSEITGYAACTNKKTINILQITDNPSTDPTAYSLKNQINDTSSLIRQYGGTGKLKDYELIFDTMSVDQFLQLYVGVPYTTATASSTNKLSGYHILILDNQTDQIKDDHGALTNIKDEISKSNGIGVLFTNGSVTYENQSNYLPSNNLLFENQKTYTRLSYIGTPTADNNNGNYNDDDPYYIFNFSNILSATGLTMNKELLYHTVYLTKSNEGGISRYPYEIKNALKAAETSYVPDATIDYNKNAAIPLVGWYCMSDARSPIVRTVVPVSDSATPYTGIYSSSPNDVKNNYYLFHRGKIFYSGISLKQADVLHNDDEIKLFINTLLAAYKASGRVISIEPVITITNPVPVSDQITLSPEDIGSNTDLSVKFKIEDSSSNMKLSLLWNDSATTLEGWNTKIYQVSATGETLVTNLNDIENGTYLVKIPVSQLEGSHKLTIVAQNGQGSTTTLNTTIEYTSQPIKVTIDNSDLIKNVDKDEQYLYIDIDYAMIDREAEYLNNSYIVLEFTVADAWQDASLSFQDEAGNNITLADSVIHVKDNAAKQYVLNQKVPEGSYYVYLSASLLKGISSKEVTITATIDSTHSGSSAVILLRRSLFQLD